MSEIEQTFDAYIAAARRAWLVWRDYRFGDATPRQVNEANAAEAAAERAHRDAVTGLAEAWDEGYAVNRPRPDTNPTPNPYRDQS
jgi:hypothetical protein